MGMAASQARFLSLTARKSNVEYEGQQVNQQRTALANESANLYNKLTSISVPTPPSTSDYYEVVYTFDTNELDNSSTSGNTSYTLNNIYTTVDGTYANLSYTAYKWQAAATTAYQGTITSSDDDSSNSSYKVSLVNGSTVDATKLSYSPTSATVNLDLSEGCVTIGGVKFNLDESCSTLTSCDETCSDCYSVTKNSNGTYSITVSVESSDECTDESENSNLYISIGGQCFNVKDNGNGTYSCTVCYTCGEEEDDVDCTSESKNATVTISGSYVDENGKTYPAVSYLNSSFTQNGGKSNQDILTYTYNNQTYFVTASELAKNSFNSSTSIQNVGYTQTVDYPCTYETSSSGRYSSLTITDDYGFTHTFSLNVENVQNEEAYEQAMLDYEYQQALYEKEVADINAKTESIQQQDRTLELRLKQLDTEQNALSTEMDAVSKVIEDNIDSTFNTFA